MVEAGSANASWTNRAANDGAELRRPPAPRPPFTPATKRALELVAMRGKDVIGVRHLLAGTRATLGRGPDAFARIAVGDDGQDITVAEVDDKQFVLYVPPRARVRSHLASGLGQLGIGPQRIVLEPGDRTVLVLPGGIQIRAQIVPIETFTRGRLARASRHPARWLAIAASVYVAALVLCATLAPSQVPTVSAALQRAAHQAQAAAIAAP